MHLGFASVPAVHRSSPFGTNRPTTSSTDRTWARQGTPTDHRGAHRSYTIGTPSTNDRYVHSVNTSRVIPSLLNLIDTDRPNMLRTDRPTMAVHRTYTVGRRTLVDGSSRSAHSGLVISQFHTGRSPTVPDVHHLYRMYVVPVPHRLYTFPYSWAP